MILCPVLAYPFTHFHLKVDQNLIYKTINRLTVFPQIVSMETILFWIFEMYKLFNDCRNNFPPYVKCTTWILSSLRCRKYLREESIYGREVIAEIQFLWDVDLDPTFIYQVTMFFKKLLTANVDENKLLLSKQTNATQLEFCASQLIMYCTTKTKVARSRSFEFWVESFMNKSKKWKQGFENFLDLA